MLLLLLIPLYYTVGDRRGSALQTYLLRSLGELFAMYLTMGLLFVPKMIYVLRGVRRGEAPDTEDDFGRSATAATATGADTADDPLGTRRQTNYTEMSASDLTGESFDGPVGTDGPLDQDSSRPNFVSMNVSHGSTFQGATNSGSRQY